MNPKKVDEIRGVRLAFAQGGHEGFKLVFLTPPIEIKRYPDICEARWTPNHKRMALKYSNAPTLINNELGNNGYKYTTNFPLLKSEIKSVNRPTPVAKFASKFRTRRYHVSDKVARQIIKIYEKRIRKGGAQQFLIRYEEALPKPPPQVDKHRSRTYRDLLKQAEKGDRLLCFGHGSP